MPCQETLVTCPDASNHLNHVTWVFRITFWSSVSKHLRFGISTPSRNVSFVSAIPNINQIVFTCLVDWLHLILRNSIMYIYLALRSSIYIMDIYIYIYEYIYIYIYIYSYYIIQHRDRRWAPLSPPSLSNSVLFWDTKFSCESTAFNSLPPRRLMWSAKKRKKETSEELVEVVSVTGRLLAGGGSADRHFRWIIIG